MRIQRKPLKEVQACRPAHNELNPKSRQPPQPVKQTKPSFYSSKKTSKRKLPQKVRKGKPAFQLVDEEDEAQQESIPQREDDDPDLELAKKLSLETPQEKGEGEGDNADLERAIKLSLDPAFLTQRTESDTESGAPKGDKVQGEIVSSTVTSGVSIPVSDPEKAHEALAGPDPEPMNEDQTGSDSGKLHVSLADQT
ncbi:hypothetical protein Tco_1320972 [Tanacetum coccineum]